LPEPAALLNVYGSLTSEGDVSGDLVILSIDLDKGF
jgi:hypothetical protein